MSGTPLRPRFTFTDDEHRARNAEYNRQYRLRQKVTKIRDRDTVVAIHQVADDLEDHSNRLLALEHPLKPKPGTASKLSRRVLKRLKTLEGCIDSLVHEQLIRKRRSTVVDTDSTDTP